MSLKWHTYFTSTQTDIQGLHFAKRTAWGRHEHPGLGGTKLTPSDTFRTHTPHTNLHMYIRRSWQVTFSAGRVFWSCSSIMSHIIYSDSDKMSAAKVPKTANTFWAPITMHHIVPPRMTLLLFGQKKRLEPRGLVDVAKFALCVCEFVSVGVCQAHKFQLMLPGRKVSCRAWLLRLQCHCVPLSQLGWFSLCNVSWFDFNFNGS